MNELPFGIPFPLGSSPFDLPFGLFQPPLLKLFPLELDLPFPLGFPFPLPFESPLPLPFAYGGGETRVLGELSCR